LRVVFLRVVFLRVVFLRVEAFFEPAFFRVEPDRFAAWDEDVFFRPGERVRWPLPVDFLRVAFFAMDGLRMGRSQR